MEVRDYNGPGEWSLDAIRKRYVAYAQESGQERIRRLVPRELTQGQVRWVYPIMDEVIAGIEAGDPACARIGVEFIESDHRQAFGRRLHSNTARALRRTTLTPDLVERLRARILGMLAAGQVPREFREYAKLLRRIGLGDAWPRISEAVDRANPFVMRYVAYFGKVALDERAAGRHVQTDATGDCDGREDSRED